MHGGIVSGLGHFQISDAEKCGFPKGLCANGGRHKILFKGHGKQGFQQPIASESFIIDGFGMLGAMHQERNLTYVEVDISGHMMPQYAPWAAYKTLSYLLGREELTDHTNDAALYPSAYALYGSASSKKAVNRHQTEL
ncbi:serine carboxypeptidase domain-containing protein [Rhizoctonia solani AG-1 IA]|uniref:Serine carboxypeptidase domain-containing protein n=1 Tax=Thanatephorus cucumeris (strain AG1-IA) TaxID=983506 RepID=L8WI29_THACA|nr:serine carboxypeptidase domain-containing protein [Rhizoctonia solani AG-1 IA]